MRRLITEAALIIIVSIVMLYVVVAPLISLIRVFAG